MCASDKIMSVGLDVLMSVYVLGLSMGTGECGY